MNIDDDWSSALSRRRLQRAKSLLDLRFEEPFLRHWSTLGFLKRLIQTHSSHQCLGIFQRVTSVKSTLSYLQLWWEIVWRSEQLSLWKFKYWSKTWCLVICYVNILVDPPCHLWFRLDPIDKPFLHRLHIALSIEDSTLYLLVLSNYRCHHLLAYVQLSWSNHLRSFESLHSLFCKCILI